MKSYGRVDKIVGALAPLVGTKSYADVIRKIPMPPTSEYEIEERAILCREGIRRSDIESTIRQRYLRSPASKNKNAGQALFSNRAGRGGRAGRGNHRRKYRPTEGVKVERVAVAATPQPPRKTPPQRSTKQRENASIASNLGTTGTSARLASLPCSRADIRRRCAWPEQWRRDCVLP